nr:unnamed protein product [Meloidogyne enterolobii]
MCHNLFNSIIKCGKKMKYNVSKQNKNIKNNTKKVQKAKRREAKGKCKEIVQVKTGMASNLISKECTEPKLFLVDCQTKRWTLQDKNFLSSVNSIELKTIAATQASVVSNYFVERMFEVVPIGVYPILFETPCGRGFVGYAECEIIELEGLLSATGNLKLLMNEAVIVARNCVTTFIKEQKLGNAEKLHMLVHIIPGSSAKDGGSGGAGLAVCMLSRFLEIPPLNDSVILAEIDLKGRLYAVGGLESKLAAAKRVKLKFIIMPSSMKQMWKQLDKSLKEDLIDLYADTIFEVYKIVFPQKNSRLKL